MVESDHCRVVGYVDEIEYDYDQVKTVAEGGNHLAARQQPEMKFFPVNTGFLRHAVRSSITTEADLRPVAISFTCVEMRFSYTIPATMKRIQTEKAPAAIGPYSQAVKCGDTLFVSGQLPLRPDGEMVSGEFALQVRQVLSNIVAIVGESGSGMSGRPYEIAKLTAYLTDLGRYAEFNEIYSEFFGESRPARAVVEVAGLPKGAPVEVECIAMA